MRRLRLRTSRLEARPREAGRPDPGETLIEALVTISILGIAVVALLGSVLIGIKTSVQHRKQTQAQGELRSWAERISSRTYINCADAAAFGGAGALPPGLSGQVTAVQYWDGASSAFRPPPCGTDSGLQRVTLRITVDSGITPAFSRELHVVVRRP